MPIKEPLSPLAQGRGLKRAASVIANVWSWSPLAQGRGLKRVVLRYVLGYKMSPLAQGRGLKQPKIFTVFVCPKVAPRTGAWIETLPA